MEDLLWQWREKGSNAVQALIADRFLPQPEMQYLVRKLVEISEGPKKDQLEEKLSSSSFSWMQLKGGKVRPGFIPKKVGVFIPFVRLHNHLAEQYPVFFPAGAGISRFIDELEQAQHPGQFLKEKKKGHENIRVKADNELLWFYWNLGDGSGSSEELLSTLARERATYLGRRYQKVVLLVFDAISFSHEMHYGTGKGLYRPAWPEGMTKEDFELIPDAQGRFGLARKRPGTGSVLAAEAVGRSAFLPLSELALCKVQHWSI